MSRASAKKTLPAPDWNARLDAAVMAYFPGVECETGLNIFSMTYTSSWWQAGTDNTRLKPALARQVKAFVAGFMASEAGTQP